MLYYTILYRLRFINEYIKDNRMSSSINQSLIGNKQISFIPLTKMNLLISSLLYKENLIFSYSINYYNKKIKIYLNKIDSQFIFSKIRRISKPSKKVYFKVEELRRKSVKEGRFYIISTNIGIITSNEAIKKNISGEILFEILF